MAKPLEFIKYKDAFIAAKKAALDAEKENQEDGGTCNMDSVTIQFPKKSGWSKKYIAELSAATGVGIGEKITYGYFKGSYFINGIYSGQGNLRSRMAHAAYNKLKEANLDVLVYYQMD